MNDLTSPGARVAIDVMDDAEIARATGLSGDVVPRSSIEDTLSTGPLILDGLRRRPRYFDGRFLTGADLTRDQDYVRQRQADMARASGTGIIEGLQVRTMPLTTGQTIRIQPGLGLTPQGDLVMLSAVRDVPLMDLPSTRQLDAALGLSEEPRVPVGRRTGLFILALRAVEFTANPIAAYPRTLTGQRSFQDGDIVEATAVTLIPFPESRGTADLGDARRQAARTIFQSAGGGAGIPQDALPLAMVALERGAVRWIDADMVRRQSAGSAVVDAGFAARPRSLAEAHIAQHRAHLADILSDMQARGQAPVFPASRYFGLLPPAAQMPAAAIQPDQFGFHHIYFPPTVDVDLAFVPSDEIGAVVEDSLALPPIDLDSGAQALQGTGILILVPVSRARYQRFAASLPGDTIAVPADPGASGASAATDLLTRIASRSISASDAAAQDSAAQQQADADALRINAWQAAFQEAVAALPTPNGGAPLVWFSRRRAIAYGTYSVGAAVPAAGDDVVTGAIVDANLARLGLTSRMAAVDAQATPLAVARALALLGSPQVADSDILTVSVLTDLESAAAPVRLPPVPIPLPPVKLPPVAPAPAPAPTSKLPPVATPINLAVAKSGLDRIALATTLGTSTAARDDTTLNLSAAEVLDIAQDYSGANLGEGLARAQQALGSGWPDVKGAVWLGGTGKALALDAAFRAIPGEETADFAGLLKDAAAKQDASAIDALLAKMN
ncbi:MAG TPA: hypothetical protein VFW19_03890 [Allosphingosinicella sp.]|nr:hypothetical protein [Allosphingosinicella sp.]